MAAVGAEVVISGVVSFLFLLLLLILLSILLTALCSECSRRSFELGDSEADKHPSALIRVVKLEEAAVERENPTINEIQNDEKEFNPGDGDMMSSVPPWRSHLETPQSLREVPTNGSAAVMKTGSEPAGEGNPEEENSFPSWRSHLNPGVNGSAPPDHTYDTIGGGSSPATNQEPGEEHSARSAAAGAGGDSVYARVSKKVRPATPPPHHTPEEEDEDELSSPPLPHRTPQPEA
ncbi:uncharacterized protein si:ch73-204p21.2 [Sebastes umbrosus]|uniref:uncharacterized protein si:ch73-204p21.2 n=1 Tax=Sebastes umbrosus TaxID=72105 RepID=UPI00189D8E65|nr:uncharacterized protein si:ch73-204p21.2 [Sebastes umbrosus]